MQDVLLFTTVSLCLMTDLLKRKIYNIVLLPALLLAIVANSVQYGWSGIYESTFGFIVGIITLIIPFILGGIGAGDVKLMSVIGAIKGPEFALYTFIYMGIAGGIISVLLLCYRGSLIKVIKEILEGLCLLLNSGFKLWSFSSDNDKVLYPYGIAIAIGAVVTFALMG